MSGLGCRKSDGFTLIELLVVIAIIAILAAILFPVFVRAKEASKITKCSSNFKQINTALLQYVDDNNSTFPTTSFYCRLFELAQTGHATGPYLIDQLDRYIKNRAVWLCPSLQARQKPGKTPDNDQTKYQDYPYAYNCGSTPGLGVGRVPSNILWMHWVVDAARPKSDMNPLLVSGSKTSLVMRPSKALLILEFPYWAPTPHQVGSEGGYMSCAVNAAFFDGHVKLMRSEGNMQLYYIAARGWWPSDYNK